MGGLGMGRLVVGFALVSACMLMLAAGPASAQDGCSNAAFRTGPSAHLPDCRAYEQVSPVDKNGTDAAVTAAFPANTTQDDHWLYKIQAAADGNAITYAATGAIGDAVSATVRNQILSRRGGAGWSTRTINPPFDATTDIANGANHSNFWGFTDDLSKGIVFTQADPPPTPDAPPDTLNYYLVTFGSDFAGDSYKLLFGGVPDDPSSDGNRQVSVEAHSEDLEHIAFELNPGFTGNSQVHEAYLDEDGNAQHRIASIDPVSGDPIAATLGAGWLNQKNETPTAMSEDGSRILFMSPYCCASTTQPIGPTSTPADLYLRDTEPDGGGPATTTWVSEPEPGVPADPTSPRLDAFWDASADASRIFFTSGEKLTSDSTADPTTGSFGDLYVYDYEADELRDISIDTGHANGARVLGVTRVTPSGDDAYFVAQGTLGTGEGTDGQPNLFHWQDGPGNGELTFIATLAPHTNNFKTSDLALYTNSGFDRPARVSSDGRYLVFDSRAQLSGEDTDSDSDVYLYDSEADTLACVSCDPGGPTPGESRLHAIAAFGDFRGEPATAMQTGHFAIYRNLTEDSGTIFFESESKLVPGDSNGRRDVYAYDVETGEVSLISTGKSDDDSFFLDASPDGSDVFIAARERLVPSDIDALYDVYDARVGGGLAGQHERPAPGCAGDECQGDSSAAPPAADPATARLVGPGNPAGEGASRRCAQLERKAQRLKQRAKRARRAVKRAKRRARGAEGKRAKHLEQTAKRQRKRLERERRKARRAARAARTCADRGAE